jgi:hypothetical protein
MNKKGAGKAVQIANTMAVFQAKLPYPVLENSEKATDSEFLVAIKKAQKQAKELFGKKVDLLKEFQIPMEINLKNSVFIYLPALIGIREVANIFDRKKIVSTRSWGTLDDWGVGYSGVPRLFAVECSARPALETLGVNVMKLNKDVRWVDFLVYVLAFYQKSIIFDRETGVCFPEISRGRNKLFYCQYSEISKILGIHCVELDEHPENVGPRRVIEFHPKAK